MNARHSHETDQHYTPAHIVEAARYTLGSIDLDPASCAFAQKTVKAKRYYDGELSDGLTLPWDADGVFVNPPGKVKGRRGGQALWWAKACAEFDSPRSIVFLSFSVELLQTAQQAKALRHPLEATAVAVPKSRIAYDRAAPSCQRCGDGEALMWMPPANSRCSIGYWYCGRGCSREPTDGPLVRVAGKSPPHASMILLLTWDAAGASSTLARFVEAFGEFGYVRSW